MPSAEAEPAYGYGPEGDVMQNRDILRNLSRLQGTCIVCGSTIVDTVMPDVKEAWTVCKCGSIVKVNNTNVWC